MLYNIRQQKSITAKLFFVGEERILLPLNKEKEKPRNRWLRSFPFV